MSRLNVANKLRKRDLVSRINFLEELTDRSDLSDRTIDRLDQHLAEMYKEIVYNDPHFREKLQQANESAIN